MGLMDQPSSVLHQYTEASASTPPAGVEQDFRQVAPQVPHSAFSNGLSDAFRSNETPSFGQMISHLFGQSNGEQRAGILQHLPGAAGPAALSGIGGLSSLLQGCHSSLQGNTVSAAQAQQIPPDAVQNLAEQAAKNDPSVIDRASEFYAQHPTLVQGLGAGALALVMSRISQHR